MDAPPTTRVRAKQAANEEAHYGQVDRRTAPQIAWHSRRESEVGGRLAYNLHKYFPNGKVRQAVGESVHPMEEATGMEHRSAQRYPWLAPVILAITGVVFLVIAASGVIGTAIIGYLTAIFFFIAAIATYFYNTRR